ncbi:MAG: hypothetical protein DMG25_06605 [Acidobacteria bacterium]|nr:MAG: hypothetical protein DMG25_06605 [Acidobacteriota bacterium]
MTRRAYVYFALTFLLGVVVGGGSVFYYGWHSGVLHRGAPSRRGVVGRLTRELSLSDAQAQQLGQIMEDAEKKHQQLQERCRPQFQALHKETRDRIRKILNPDQVARFDEINRQFEQRMHQRIRP